jgi:hypothetical protein
MWRTFSGSSCLTITAPAELFTVVAVAVVDAFAVEEPDFVELVDASEPVGAVVALAVVVDGAAAVATFVLVFDVFPVLDMRA